MHFGPFAGEQKSSVVLTCNSHCFSAYLQKDQNRIGELTIVSSRPVEYLYLYLILGFSRKKYVTRHGKDVGPLEASRC